MNDSVERLTALGLPPKDQQRLKTLVPQITDITKSYGKLTFSIDSSKYYNDHLISKTDNSQKNKSPRGEKKLSFKFITGIDNKLVAFIWFASTGLAAVLNSKAFESLFSESWGVVEKSLSVFGSWILIYFVDILISGKVSFHLSQKDADRNKVIKIDYTSNKISEKDNERPIDKSKRDGEKEVFNKVQKEYLSETNKKKILSFINPNLSWIILIVYFSLELAASINSIFLYEIPSLLSFAAPLLAALLNLMTGYYKGRYSSYPEDRKTISKRYAKEAELVLVKEKDLKNEIDWMNYVTREYVRNPRINSEDIYFMEKSRKTVMYMSKLKSDFRKELNNIEQSNKVNLSNLPVNEESKQILQGIISIIEEFENNVDHEIQSGDINGYLVEQLSKFKDEYWFTQRNIYKNKLEDLSNRLSNKITRENEASHLSKLNSLIEQHNELKNSSFHRNESMNFKDNSTVDSYSPYEQTRKKLSDLQNRQNQLNTILSQISEIKRELELINGMESDFWLNKVKPRYEQIEQYESELQEKLTNIQKKIEPLQKNHEIQKIQETCRFFRENFRKEENAMINQLQKKIKELQSNFSDSDAPLGAENVLELKIRDLRIDCFKEIIRKIENYDFLLEDWRGALQNLGGNISIIDLVKESFKQDKNKYEGDIEDIQS